MIHNPRQVGGRSVESSADPFVPSRFATDMGVELVGASPGKVRLAVGVTERVQNRHGAAHGGVIFTLMDVALGMSAQRPDGNPAHVATVNLNLQFLVPGKGRLMAEGRLLRAGRSLAFCEGEVHDERGTLVAKATGTFRIPPTRTCSPPCGLLTP
jgi:uncharacterized protein (TIGR00369 family)